MTNDRLRADLDDVARAAGAQLERASARDATRRGVGRALALMVVVPAIAVVVQAARLMLTRADTPGPSWWWLVPLTLVPAVAHLLRRFMTGRRVVNRGAALAAVDDQLASADRLRTADAFLAEPARSGFMQAAVEDATRFVEAGRAAGVTPPAARIHARIMERIAVPGAIALLVLAFWLSRLAPSPDPLLITHGAANPVAGAAEARVVEDVLPPPEPAVTPEAPPTPDREMRREQTRSRANAPVSRSIPEGAEEAHGSMGVGQTSESDQSSNPSSARGAPSSQGQPSKPSKTPKKKSRKPSKKPRDRTQEEQPQKETKDPAGSTAGQGSSKGSNRNPAVSDWSSRDQVHTPDDDQTDEEEDVDDEEEEQESRGGLQPNLRDRRPPVNRDLRIGFGNGKSPDANSRGGPSQPKKSRGVASFVLGVPIPDRVKGQPNPGKTKVTQQRIEPEAEDADPQTASGGLPRAGANDPVFHPVLNPWMRELVRSYFLEQRQVRPQSPNAPPTEAGSSLPPPVTAEKDA